MKIITVLLFVFLAPSFFLKADESDLLSAGFVHPPEEAKPRIYFLWLNNLVSKEGITHDLEEIHAKGFAGVTLVSDAGEAGPMPSGPDFMSPEWRELLKHAVREAARLGLEVNLDQCSGWNDGGPWITDEMAEQHYVQSELQLKGPRMFMGNLPMPSGNAKAYHDIAVQAFRVTEVIGQSELPKLKVTASSSRDDMPIKNLTDDDPSMNSIWGSKGLPTPQHPEWVQLSLPESASIESVWIMPRYHHGPKDIEIQTSLDGVTFATVKKCTLLEWGEQLVTFPATLARDVRVVATSSYCDYNMQMLEIAFRPPFSADARRLAIKASRESVEPTDPLRDCTALPLEPTLSVMRSLIDSKQMLDLTNKLQPDGSLMWEVPEGDWVLLRTGYTTTGRTTTTSAKGGEGLEKDFFNKQATEFHWNNLTKLMLDDSADFVGKTIKYVYDDSWECGMPNWTPAFLDEFKKNRGYDALPYLPTLAGYTVGSLDMTDRFLYDYRKTIADCLAENHYAYSTSKAHESGIGTQCQAGGPCSGQLMTMDALRNLGACDVPMGEFWAPPLLSEGTHQNKIGKQTSSAVHVYGKRWAAGEAFTTIGPHWEEGPAQLKSTADIAFCEGFNRFVFQSYTSSRPEDGKPGYEYFAGTHFNRNITWWEQMGAWTDYIARSQWLLSRGLFVADVCFYNGDWAPNYVELKRVYPELGKGFDYDMCNAEVLLTRMTVKDGLIILPDGMRYRLLSLPNRDFMPLEVLEKIKALVNAGATVVGPRPVKDPGLKDYPDGDEKIRRLADELWGDCDGKNITEHVYGKGRVIWGTPLHEVLAKDKIFPDMTYSGRDNDTFIDFIHRQEGETEIYFVANRMARDEAVQCTFRVAGFQPELWDPITGGMRDATTFTQLQDGRTIVPLEFAPNGSTFVIFRKPIPADRQGTSASNYPQLEQAAVLDVGWTVAFDPAWGGPASARFENLRDWTQSDQVGIRYYSGTAVYTSDPFDLPAGVAGNPQTRLFLDLGNVKELAEVTLNGKLLGVLWTSPFRVDVTGLCKPSGNRLEIRVTNYWPNRLIGDAGLSADKRFTHTNVTKFKKDSGLSPSGLLGPIQILKAAN